jgi:hypothetical protein
MQEIAVEALARLPAQTPEEAMAMLLPECYRIRDLPRSGPVERHERKPAVHAGIDGAPERT